VIPNTKLFSAVLLSIFVCQLLSAQIFSDVSSVTGTDFGGNKDGGVSWADINNDGCLDLLFNTTDNNASRRSRILLSDCSLPNPSFTDITATHIDGFTKRELDRSIFVADLNNDGYLDLGRNISNRFEIYLNKGPTATPPFSFGDANQDPNFTVTSIAGGMNTEGFGWVDYNNDGWLDLLIENHSFGIDIFENPKNGTANFIHVTPNTDLKGLPRGCGNGSCPGDYMALTDWNDDGFVDFGARKFDATPPNNWDIWQNDGDGTFTPITTFDQEANNSNKGGILFCDFDNDGDFDLFWTENGTNQIFEQTGLNSGNFSPISGGAEPQTSSGVTPDNVDGCACGDVDNDGDLDLFLSRTSGSSYLYLNNGAFNFTRDNSGITATGRAQGASFGDYDNDGDLDLYYNRNSGNRLYRNGTNDLNFLKLKILKEVSPGVFRDDIGATAILKNCDGTVESGIRELNGTRGHGSQDPAVIHFGLPRGPLATYLVEVKFTNNGSYRGVLDTTIVPTFYTDQTIVLYEPSSSSVLDGCHPSALPVELISFDVKAEKEAVRCDWSTATEVNNDYFNVQRLIADEWITLDRINGAGNSALNNHYTWYDEYPVSGYSYYRLQQVDFDGTTAILPVKQVFFESDKCEVTVYPNPNNGNFVIKNSKGYEGLNYFLVDQNGKQVASGVSDSDIGLNLQSGIYFLLINCGEEYIRKKVIIERGKAY